MQNDTHQYKNNIQSIVFNELETISEETKTEDIKISKIVKKLNSFLYLKEINYNLNKSEISLTFGKLTI